MRPASFCSLQASPGSALDSQLFDVKLAFPHAKVDLVGGAWTWPKVRRVKSLGDVASTGRSPAAGWPRDLTNHFVLSEEQVVTLATQGPGKQVGSPAVLAPAPAPALSATACRFGSANETPRNAVSSSGGAPIGCCRRAARLSLRPSSQGQRRSAGWTRGRSSRLGMGGCLPLEGAGALLTEH